MNKDNIIDTFTEMAPKYEEIVNTELSRFWGISYNQFVNTLLNFTPVNRDGSMLDIATGTSVIPTKLLDKVEVKKHIHGLDITHSMLIQAKNSLSKNNHQDCVLLTCASAMKMPYAQKSFDLAICGLATHHMNIDQLLREVYRVLRFGGQLSFADVGSSKFWIIPGVKWILRLLAYGFYIFTEGPNRAWAEASAVSNIRTAEEWYSILKDLNFKNISIKKLKSRYFWIPSPLVITAEKLEEETRDKTQQITTRRSKI